MSKQILLFLLSCVLLPPMSLGQNMTSQYVGSSDFAWVSNVPNCGGTTVCWHALNGTGGLYASKIFSANGHVVALDPSGNAYTYNDYPANSWTAHPEWGTVYGAEYGGDGHVYALYGPGGGTCINQGGHSLGQWTGSGWLQLTYCFTSFSMSSDAGGLVVLIDTNGTLWYTTAFGFGTYQHSPGAPFPMISATAINSGAGTYAAVKSDHTVWYFNGTAWSQLAGTANQISADASGTIYKIGTDGFAYQWNGSAWVKLSGGGKTFLANGGTMQIFALGPLSGGNSVYRFPDETVRHTRTIKGNATCLGDACNGTTHTITAQAGWGTSYGVANHLTVAPTTNVNLSGHGDVVDPFTCFEMPGTSACQPATPSNVSCSVRGANFFSDSGFGFNGTWNPTSGSAAATSVSTNRVAGFYVYSVVDNCSPQGSGDMVVGGNIDHTMLDVVRTDAVVTIAGWCFSPDGFQPFSCHPYTITPVNITSRSTTYGADTHCTKH